MRCLILGGDGMLGHQLLASWQGRHDVRATLHRPLADYRQFGVFTESNSYGEVDVTRPETIARILDHFGPDAVVNATGIVKQRKDAAEVSRMQEINGNFPHLLSQMCENRGARLIQMSTDCVFNGRRGGYVESDDPDADDDYGKSKAMGELATHSAVTLRTSIIGLELSRKTGLIEWFLAQRGTIRGFTRAIYSGLTTIEMARVIERVLCTERDLCGVWHVSSQPISKYDLLHRFSQFLGRRDVTIESDDVFQCDRSLDGSAFAERTRYRPPTWDAMLSELAGQFKAQGAERHAA